MRHVITLIASKGNLLPTDELVSIVGKCGRAWLDEGRALDLFVPVSPTAEQRQTLQHFCSERRIDCIIQPAQDRIKKLLISDMDSTMIHQECIDELADVVGIKAHVSAITQRAMNGELDFKDALRERVALLKGLEEVELLRVFSARITLMQGADILIETMKQNGAYTVLVSGGFTFFTKRVASLLGFDADEANMLEVEDGKLTGKVREPILDKESKRGALHRIASKRGITLNETLAIGDGANDLPMLMDAGLGIAYHAKPVVVQQARAAIHYNDLTAILYAQGIAKKDWITP
jgi:phosphoserine phosphatase